MADNSVENDALPEDPRASVQNEPQNGAQPTDVQESEAHERVLQDFQAPTGDWGFKRMLLKLSEELTDDNLDKLKFRFSGGQGGLGKGVQEKIKKPIELFRILEERHWLTSDNLLKLQAALRDIGRMDLVRVTAEYAQKMDNVLYFYQPSESVNGYRSVKLHLCNCNYENTDRNRIQMIRLRFSELVGCAQEDIVIVGLEPATSLILTFHVPESFIVTFKELLKMSSCKARLRDIAIDMIEIEGEDELFHCSDEDVSTKSTTEEQKKLYNVYQLLENKAKLLDSAEIKLLKLNKKIETLENEKFQCEALLKSLKPNFVKSGGNMSSVKHEILRKFEALLQRPELKSYDKAFILSLLNTNSKMISTVVAESHESLIKHMEKEIEQMKFQIAHKTRELRNLEALNEFESLKYRTLTVDDMLHTHLFSRFARLERDREAKLTLRRDFPDAAKEWYQHFELEEKMIADKIESESKREHTVSYQRKEYDEGYISRKSSEKIRQPNKKSGYDSIPHAESDSNEGDNSDKEEEISL